MRGEQCTSLRLGRDEILECFSAAGGTGVDDDKSGSGYELIKRLEVEGRQASIFGKAAHNKIAAAGEYIDELSESNSRVV